MIQLMMRVYGGNYAQTLVTRGGRPLYRLLAKARLRYEAQKPKRVRASALRKAYFRKSRGWR